MTAAPRPENGADHPTLVLVLLGSGHHPFTRLVTWVDTYAAERRHTRVAVQHGQSPPPMTAHGHASLDRDELRDLLQRADVVVTHGGAATISEARRSGHRPIVVARDPELDEHIDDHQLRLVSRLDTAGMVLACASQQQLAATLDKALAQPADFRLDPVDGNAATVARHAGWLIDLLALTARDDPPLPTPRATPAKHAWPDVTVVVAARDRPDLLPDTVRCVMAQDYPGTVHTLVVVHDDAAEPVLAAPGANRPVWVVRTPAHAGRAMTRNAGVRAAHTELVAFCAAGDTWLPHKLRAQVEVLHAEPHTEAVCCGVRTSDEPITAGPTLDHTTLNFADLLCLSSATPIPHPSTLLVRRHALTRGCGLLDERVPGGYGAHYDLLLRLARRAAVRTIPEAGVRLPQRPRPRDPAQWRAVAGALRWLLARYPEFRLVPRGLARISGRIAVAEAASGRRGAALEWTFTTIRARPTEPRAYLALAVAFGIPADSADRLRDRA